MAATTIIVTSPPIMTRNSPTCWSFGIKLLQKMINAVQAQVIITKLTKLCQGSATNSGWYTPYIATVTFAGMEMIEARSKIQPKKLSQPQKKPIILPHFAPGVIEAQWYTPPDEGTELASSAIEAPTKP
jgi:hypothetical protein